LIPAIFIFSKKWNNSPEFFQLSYTALKIRNSAFFWQEFYYQLIHIQQFNE